MNCIFKRGLIAAFVSFLLDRLTKEAILAKAAAAMDALYAYTVTPFFNLILAWNKGVSFSLFTSPNLSTRVVLCSIALLLSGILFYWMWKAKSLLESIAYGMILGGALGNVYDRIKFGAVVDFLDFHYAGYHWYTFNIADTTIVIGAFLLAVQMLFLEDKKS